MTDFNSEQYKRVMAACKERDKFPTQAWIPDEEKCVHTQLHEADEVLVDFDVQTIWTNDPEYKRKFKQHTDAMKKVDFTEDSEYQRMFNQHTDAMKQQSELIERWVEQEEKRLPPKPPMTPFS